jgi:hypothetical protein
MFTQVAGNARKAISTVAAVAIVSAAGLVMDQAHLAAAPRGTVEVGELTPIVGTVAALPEVVVLAKRESGAALASTTELPEVVVVARRVTHMMAGQDRKRVPAPAINAGL